MFPKSIHLVEDCLRVSSFGKNDTVLDYFGGFGTTAHATINLNRQDSGKRKYILIEMGHHFDTALMPRVKKAVYAEKWKDAKPISRESRLSHIVKYQRIESYEDALNNIEFNKTEHQNLLLNEHQLSYMLESGTKESPTFLNISDLQKQKLVVIIWRKTAGWKQEDYEQDYQFIQENKLTEGATEVYVNTDSLVPEAESLDPLFKRLMFAG